MQGSNTVEDPSILSRIAFSASTRVFGSTRHRNHARKDTQDPSVEHGDSTLDKGGTKVGGGGIAGFILLAMVTRVLGSEAHTGKHARSGHIASKR